MKREKICILLRVYNRMEDLENCLDIIKDTWKNFDYYIVVVANGKNQGFRINEQYFDKIDRIVDLENNAGHLKGNAQLLLEGIAYIPADCSYTLILEADTWMYGDEIIKKYINILNKEQAVWASANWYSHLYSLATDYAIINTAFIRQNPGVFEYSGNPECYAANYIINNGLKYVYITENMPVHLPSYIKHYPFALGIRFNVFPESKMVTHHIEVLKNGIKTKKHLFNTLAGVAYFKGEDIKPDRYLKIKVIFAIKLSYLFPLKGWVKKTKQQKIDMIQ